MYRHLSSDTLHFFERKSKIIIGVAKNDIATGNGSWMVIAKAMIKITGISLIDNYYSPS